MTFATSSPEYQQVELTIFPINNDTGEPSTDAVTVKQWTSYAFENDFTTPTDAFHFTLGLDRPADASFRLRTIRPGAKVALRIAGKTQATGYIDDIEYATSPSGGIQVNVVGRDSMGRVVDANSDPTIAFKTGQTVEDFLTTLLTPYGFREFQISNDANRTLQTGMAANLRYLRSKYAAKLNLSGEVIKRKPISASMVKPYHGEGLFAFASRIMHRHGLWLWAHAQGDKVVVSKPNFDGDPTFRLRRSTQGQDNNMLSCSVRASIADQPTIIFADGFSGGGEFGKGRNKVVAINPSVLTYDPTQAQLVAKYKDAKLIELTPHANPVVVPKCKPLFLHDDESKTADQLERFCKKELALLRKKALTVRATVEGHGQMVDGQFVPWAVDTIVDFADEVSGVIEPLWVLGRAFHKSSAGTTTDLQLIRPHSLEL